MKHIIWHLLSFSVCLKFHIKNNINKNSPIVHIPKYETALLSLMWKYYLKKLSVSVISERKSRGATSHVPHYHLTKLFA